MLEYLNKTTVGNIRGTLWPIGWMRAAAWWMVRLPDSPRQTARCKWRGLTSQADTSKTCRLQKGWYPG